MSVDIKMIMISTKEEACSMDQYMVGKDTTSFKKLWDQLEVSFRCMQIKNKNKNYRNFDKCLCRLE